jgi:hypothetical protein
MSVAIRRLVASILIVALLPLAGCGYLIFEERVGQPKGEIDWGIFALDAVGLLFGIIPGVIAFAVDFSTGCIYLPSSPAYSATPSEAGGWQLVATVPPFASEAEVSAALQHALADRPALQAALRDGAVEWRRELPPG